MALVKFLIYDSNEGFTQPQSATDELSLGKITLLGVSGVAIAAGGQLISGIADPVSAQDAASKAYVDAMVQGLNVHTAVRLATIAALPAYTQAGAGVGATLTATSLGALTVDGVLTALGNRILVKNEANSKNGVYTVTTAGVTAAAATGSITAIAGSLLVDGETFTISDGTNTPTIFEFDSGGGVGGGNIAVTFTGGDSDTTVASAIASAINGVGGTLNVTAAPSGASVTLTNDNTGASGNVAISETVLDGGFITSGMSGGATGVAYVLTRATDFDGSPSSEVQDGSFFFVGEGSLAATGWVQVTNQPITVDTTTMLFNQFNAATIYTGAEGILLTGSAFSVELDTAAAAQTAGSGGGSSGLEFDTTGAAAKLRAAVNGTAGLERTASGLAAKLNGTTLQSNASGLSVKGLPSLFEIATVATSANVTAANLGTLTAGPSSDASFLHSHGSAVEVWTTLGTVTLGGGVYIGGNNVVSEGDASIVAKSHVIGVAVSTVTTGLPVSVVSSGVVVGALSGATANDSYYLGPTTGLPVLYAALSGGDRQVRLGFAKNATDLEVRIMDFGKK